MAVLEKTIDILGDDSFSSALIARTMADGQPVDLYDEAIHHLRRFALYNMQKIESVNFPNVTYCSGHSLQNCSSLKKVTMEKCKTLSTEDLRNCPNLTEINIPLLSSVGEYCFAGTGIETANFPYLTSMYSYGTFSYCTSLKTVILPKLTICGTNSFYHCTSLEQLDLPSIVNLYNGFATSCSNLKTVNLGPNLKTIAESAFSGTPEGLVINLPISEGTISGAPWGAANAVINYDTPYAGDVPIPES